MGEVKKIRKIVKVSFWKNALFFVLCAAIAALTFIEPQFLSELISAATSGELLNRYYLIIIVLAAFLCRLALSYVKTVVLNVYRTRCLNKLSSALFSHILREEEGSIKRKTPAYLIARIIDEPTNIDGVLDFYLIDGIVGILICLGIVGYMAVQNWIVAVLTVAFVAADYIVAMKLPLRKVFKTYNEASAEWKSVASNALQGEKQIKMGEKYVGEENVFGKYAKGSLGALFKKNVLVYVQRTVGSFCKQFSYVATVVLCAVFIANGLLTVGGFTLLISLNTLLWSNVSSAENLIPLYKYGKATSERLVEILDEETEGEAVKIAEPINEVSFDGVGFSYGESRILNGLSFSAEKGKITALVGKSGCGKSTAMNVLLGFIKPDEGHIGFNGKAVTYGELLGARTKIGYVGQDSFLFNRPIIDNLLYYVEKTDENIALAESYIKLLGLGELINNTDGGINGVINDNSSNISGGEKQRLCIIREVIKNPDILILDEFTSSLDAANEKLAFDFIKEYAKNAVIIQIAHKLSAIEKSDYIFVVDGGKVVDGGTHESLLSSSEKYIELMNDLKKED